MRLKKVNLNPNGFYCECIGCGKRLSAKEERYADFFYSGIITFVDYYCVDCASEHKCL